MRITGFQIENYRGIRNAKAEGISDSPLLLLTGRNGTGKSLILEAIAAVWSGNINLPDLVGPYGNSLRIRITVSLDPHEREAVDTWRKDRGMKTVKHKSEHLLEVMSTNAEESGFYSQRDKLLETLQNPAFARAHPFTSIDLLSARRQVSIDTTTSVDLKMLDRTSVVDERRRMYEQEIRWKSSMQMPDIGTYLTSLDYRDFIAQRDGHSQRGEYDKLVSIFAEATGKNIRKPEFDPYTVETSIKVDLSSGMTHRLEDLSNGEREMLGMLYYVSQLSANGGVLLLDEPEKHLHPSLQLAVLKSMMLVADRGQLLVVTHSPSLISAASMDDVLIVEGAWNSKGNQLMKIRDADNSAGLLAELGVTKRELFQYDFMLVVEGEHDKSRLNLVFPDFISRSKVIVAGSREKVLRLHSSLASLELPTPWLCIVDRDYYFEDEYESKSKKENLFIWNYRMFENILLEPEILFVALEPAGATLVEIENQIEALAFENKSVSFDQFIESVIRSYSIDASFTKDQPTPQDKVHQRLIHHSADLQYRVENYSEIRENLEERIESLWNDNWRKVASGKSLLSGIQKKWGAYGNNSLLINAILLRIRDDYCLMPKELQRLRRVFESLISVRDSGVQDISDQDGEGLDILVSSKSSKVLERPKELNDSEEHFYGC